MKYDPQTHHRHSIRLPGYDYSQAGAYFVTLVTQGRACLFGEVVGGEMRLNAAGEMVQWEWQHLGQRFPQIQMGSFIVMPNHIHAIILLQTTVGATTVGATQAGQTGRNSANGEQSNMDVSGKGGSPRSTDGHTIDGVLNGYNRIMDGHARATRDGQMKELGVDGSVSDKIINDPGGSPLRGDVGPHGPASGSVGAMIGQWKSRVTKRLWKLPGMQGVPIWQRNYYEHIIRNDAEHERIDRYITNNPVNWQMDEENLEKLP